jgi:hypothetical protein
MKKFFDLKEVKMQNKTISAVPRILSRRLICGPSVVFLAMTLTGVAATDTQTPIKGTLQGQEADVLQGNPPQLILVDGSVSGIAAHLGLFTMTYKVTVTLPAGSSTGSAQLTAANGDMIFTTIVGQGTAVPNMPGLNQIVEINTITGGTGRFAEAKGSFTVDRLVDLATGLTSGSFNGMITSH